MKVEFKINKLPTTEMKAKGLAAGYIYRIVRTPTGYDAFMGTHAVAIEFCGRVSIMLSSDGIFYNLDALDEYFWGFVLVGKAKITVTLAE